MPARLAFGTAALVLGVVVALTLGEGMLRALRLEGDQFFEQHPRLGWVHRPGLRGTYVSEHIPGVEVRVNTAGLLGPERERERPDGVRRVFLLGDSYTESMQVPYGESWAAVLERELGPRWEVINGGVAGYGLDNTLLAFREHYHRWETDLWFLLFFTGNDVSDNDFHLYGPDRGSRPKPWFELADDRSLQLRGSPMTLPTGPTARTKAWLRTNSHLYRFAKDRVTRIQTMRSYEHASGAGIPLPWYVYRIEPHEDFERAWRTTAALLRAIREETAATGAPLVAGILPTDWRIEPERAREVLRQFPALADTTRWDLALPDRRARALMEAEGIPVLDLTPVLESARARTDDRLYTDHLTAPGHRIVGTAVAGFLREVAPDVVENVAGAPEHGGVTTRP